MKIGFLVSNFPSLSETFVVGKVEALLRQGHEVTVFAWDKGESTTLHELYDRICWRQRTVYLGRYYEWTRFGQIMRLSLRVALAFARNPRETVRFIARVIRSSNSVKTIARLVLLLAPFVGRKLDLIHIHFAWSGKNIERLGEFLGVAVVLSVLGADVTLAAGKALHSLDQLLQSADLVLCTSHYLRDKLLARGISVTPICVHAVEIDCGVFSPPNEAITQSAPTILTVARLHWKKGLMDGIYAIELLRRRGVSFFYRLVGEGPEESALRVAVTDLGLEELIEFVGPLERGAVRDAMRTADVFFLPSVREEFGTVLAEAQACGKPVVATRVGGIPEIVEDGVTGFLADPRNPGDMAEKLTTLLELPDRGRSLGLRGRERVLQLFDEVHLAPALMRHYEMAMANWRSLRSAYAPQAPILENIP